MFCSEPHEEICLKVALKFVFDFFFFWIESKRRFNNYVIQFFLSLARRLDFNKELQYSHVLSLFM